MLTSSALVLGALALAAGPANADDQSIHPGATNKLNQLNQLGQLSQVAGALDPVFGLLAPVTSVVPL
ncbi:hypothetical protein [Streptomyces katrae]|uniref:hypothetical protein n=1 Tax=Streptomyces katrae TaxID=68223 RepID=UPI001F410076|nr:hypothetical protein [Streptomyces katrae]